MIALGLISLLVGTVVTASVIQQYYHDESGKVTTVQLEEYLDSQLVANDTSFDWGELLPGESYDWNYTVQNVGSVNCTVYRLVHSLPNGWTETWTGNNTLLTPQDWLVGNLTLTVAANASGTYNWHSYLIGEQV